MPTNIFAQHRNDAWSDETNDNIKQYMQHKIQTKIAALSGGPIISCGGPLFDKSIVGSACRVGAFVKVLVHFSFADLPAVATLDVNKLGDSGKVILE